MYPVVAGPAYRQEEGRIVEAGLPSSTPVMDVARGRRRADLASRMCSKILLTHLGVELVLLCTLGADASHRAMRLESVRRFLLPAGLFRRGIGTKWCLPL